MYENSQKLSKIALGTLIVSLLSFILLESNKTFAKYTIISFAGIIDLLIMIGSLFVLVVSLVMNFKQADLPKKYDIEFFKKTICLSCGQPISDKDDYCQNCGFKLPERI